MLINGRQAHHDANFRHLPDYIFISGMPEPGETRQVGYCHRWTATKTGSLLAFVALLVYFASKDCFGACRNLNSSIFSGYHAVNSSVFSAADANTNIEVRPVGVGPSSCQQRGGCMCDCYWAYNPGACNLDDFTCCFGCCCHKERENELQMLAAAEERMKEKARERENVTEKEQRSGIHDDDGNSTTTSTSTITTTTMKIIKEEDACLCVLDVDRTLTGAQGQVAMCPGNQLIQGVPDFAFSGGELTLSEFGQSFGSTFCSRCHLGIVSAGGVGGDGEKHELLLRLKGASVLPRQWSVSSSIDSPLVVGCPDPQKSTCVKGVFDWYRRSGIVIPPHSVYFFDDHTDIFKGFGRYGFNARQVSCASRDAAIANLVGFCGAKTHEIVRKQGIFTCP